MTAPSAPLRIEIIDPDTELLEWSRGDVVGACDEPGELQEWLASLADAGAAAVRHFEPLRRIGRGANRRVQAVGRSIGDRATQLRYDGNPRRASLVRQHLFEPFDTVAEHLPTLTDAVCPNRGLTLRFTSEFRPLPGRGQQAEATLALRGSWPRLPLVVRVEPWWRDQSILSVELRTRRRLRYPRRYFRSVHSVAREVAAGISPFR